MHLPAENTSANSSSGSGKKSKNQWNIDCEPSVGAMDTGGGGGGG